MGNHSRTLKEHCLFIKQFILNPTGIGAIAPSSRHLAQQMAHPIDWENVNLVVEYGPGTGIFTGEILKKLPSEARYIGLEMNPAMYDILLQKYPDAEIHQDSVANVRRYLGKHRIGSVDAIISGLPWASFSKELQRDLLNETHTILKPGGFFVTFAYLQGLLLPAGLRFNKALKSSFQSLEYSKVVWRNTPPALIYTCRK